VAKVIPFRNQDDPGSKPRQLGPKKVRRRRKADPEDFGQLNLFDSSRQVHLTQSENYFEEALVLDEQSDPRAVDFYLKAIEHRESVDDAYCNLGVIVWHQGDPSMAIHYLSLALKHNPRHLEAHYNLANVYAEQGNVTLCRMHYEVAIQINPEFASAYYNLTLVLIALKEFDAARNTLERYIELSPDLSFDDNQSILQLLKQIKAASS
jgi:tetratricopeptide (TPR) repeat protein